MLDAESRLDAQSRAVVSRVKTVLGVASVPVFLPVPQVRPPKRLGIARDAGEWRDRVPVLILVERIEGRFRKAVD